MTDPLAGLPDAALVPVGWMREKLAEEEPSEPAPSVVQPSETTWRQKLWTAPAECRLGLREVAEALGRPKSYVYARTKAENAIPHRKLDGVIVVTAGELRGWIRQKEQVVVAGKTSVRRLVAS